MGVGWFWNEYFGGLPIIGEFKLYLDWMIYLCVRFGFECWIRFAGFRIGY